MYGESSGCWPVLLCLNYLESGFCSRLAEMELQHDSVQQTVSQLMETLSQERSRRQAAEEALGLSEEQAKR